jgi:hypothetical protein
MWRVRRVDQINAQKPANPFDFSVLALKFSEQTKRRVLLSLPSSDYCSIVTVALYMPHTQHYAAQNKLT